MSEQDEQGVNPPEQPEGNPEEPEGKPDGREPSDAETRVMASESPEAGWYPDPDDPSGPVLRYWDGSTWTSHRSRPEGGGQAGAPSAAAPDGAAAPHNQFRTAPVSDDERRNILAHQIQASAVRGLRVENQDRYQVILLEGQPVNHVLHAILTGTTCGLWGIVWAVLAATGGQKRHLISVDEYGNVVHQHLGKA